MYGKLFDKMYDGTLRSDWEALITFQQMIVLCDADGILDMTVHAIAGRTGIPLEHIENGIKVLESPDPHSRSNDEDGRRIVLLDKHRPWGWYLVNHSKYKAMQDYDTVKEQNRARKKRQRERSKSVTDSHGCVTGGHGSSPHIDLDLNNKTIVQKSGDFETFWKLYPRKEAKKKSRDAWAKLPLSDRDAVIKHIPLRKWPAQKQFTLLASTFLNGRRWEDEPESSGSQDLGKVI